MGRQAWPATSFSPRHIPGDLLRKYHISGPRYTSYPTAPQFRADFDPGAVRERFERTRSSGCGLSLYAHVPFCPTRCRYCGCNTTIDPDGSLVERYCHALVAEAGALADLAGPSRPVGQFAMGGGTPTFLTPGQMRRLVSGVRGAFCFAPDAEQSVEADPRRVDPAYLDQILDLGFNRISFGVQDLDPDVQRAINREMPPVKLEGLMAHLRSSGFRSVNVDLIYGLPGQTPHSFGETVRRIAGMGPSRVAAFGYAHVPWMCPHQKEMETGGLPSPDERTALFGLAFDLLVEAGYVHVGMDHFALPDDELVLALESGALTRNFMGYTTRRGLDLLGMGASSISMAGSAYTQNVKDPSEYVLRPAGGAWMRAILLSGEDLLRRELILDLFCNFRLDVDAFQKRFGLDFRGHFAPELAKLSEMEADGLLAVEPDLLSVTPVGRFFIRNICMCFDQYLEPAGADTRYSKTV